MQDFAAIDFETTNNERSSVCSVGVAIVRGGETANKYYSLLIKPEPEYYNYWYSQMITISMSSLRGYVKNRHHALADAEACEAMALKYCNSI